ncbi:rod-binding protein [Roseovarius sp. M141]|uniref:rod-binding protein n=1 Tax=Roseovarius sp. M141 TaxID=2583806 RepID=UPI0034E964C9
MLKSAGFGKNANFSGGIGEEQFASFQRQALADEMVKAGGLGLADAFYQSMMEASYDK